MDNLGIDLTEVTGCLETITETAFEALWSTTFPRLKDERFNAWKEFSALTLQNKIYWLQERRKLAIAFSCYAIGKADK